MSGPLCSNGPICAVPEKPSVQDLNALMQWARTHSSTTTSGIHSFITHTMAALPGAGVVFLAFFQYEPKEPPIAGDGQLPLTSHLEG